MNVVEPNTVCQSFPVSYRRSQSLVESENVFPMPSQGITPPGIVPTVTSVSSINNTVATPGSFHTKSDPRGLNVFKQEKQKVCYRELTD